MALPKQDTRELEAMRQELTKLERARRAAPHLDGRGQFFEDLTIEPGDTETVRHLLRAEPRGWQLLSPRAEAPATDLAVVEIQRTTTTLVLTNLGSVALTFDLWVY